MLFIFKFKLKSFFLYFFTVKLNSGLYIFTKEVTRLIFKSYFLRTVDFKIICVKIPILKNMYIPLRFKLYQKIMKNNC